MTIFGQHQERATDESLLRLAGATVYSQEFTQQYKLDQSNKQPPGLLTKHIGDKWAENAAILIAIAAGIVCMTGGRWLVTLHLSLDEGVILLVQFALFTTGFMAAYALLETTMCRPTSLWQTYQLDETGFYKDELGNRFAPQFVIDLLHDIKQRLPNCTFAISVFGLDPIITCTTQNGSYTVLIYDGDDIIRER